MGTGGVEASVADRLSMNLDGLAPDAADRILAFLDERAGPLRYVGIERPITATIVLLTPVLTWLLWRRTERLRSEYGPGAGNA